MPKRHKSDDDRLEYYFQKIRRLERKQEERKRLRSVAVYPAVADFHEDFNVFGDENNADQDSHAPEVDEVAEVDEQQKEGGDENQEPPVEENLDPDVLMALGDPMVSKPKYGPNINGDLARRWMVILEKGLEKEARQMLLDKHCAVPENCKFLEAPKLNPEIAAAIPPVAVSRDKKIEAEQSQLGLGIAALNKALTLLVIGNVPDKLPVIQLMSEASRILADLHHGQTVGRRKLITPTLDKKFLDVIKDVNRDEFLFGNNLAEKIKAAKSLEKSGASIRKETPKAPVLNRNFPKQGNFQGPPRYQGSARNPARGGHKKYQSSSTMTNRRPPVPAPQPPKKARIDKLRAPQ